MGSLRLDAPGSHYVALFDTADVQLYPQVAEYTFRLEGDELTVTLPIDDGEPEPASIEAARSILASLPDLHGQATAYLRALPSWPYGNDVLLWLVLVERNTVRLCFG